MIKIGQIVYIDCFDSKSNYFSESWNNKFGIVLRRQFANQILFEIYIPAAQKLYPKITWWNGKNLKII